MGRFPGPEKALNSAGGSMSSFPAYTAWAFGMVWKFGSAVQKDMSRNVCVVRKARPKRYALSERQSLQGMPSKV